MSALRDALRDLPDAVFVDVLESDGEYLVVIDLPGVRAGTVDVSAEKGRLRVEARREKDVPREFRYLREDRALFLDVDLPLAPDASAEGATGEVEKGVLTLRLPKREHDGETSIPIDGDGKDASVGGDHADHGAADDESATETTSTEADGDAESSDESASDA